MIVKILKRSASFRGSWLYHFHDKGTARAADGEKTAERVALYGLRNLGTDDPETAFKQMALTWHNAHDLKTKAGISHKGRKCTKPLITIVLSYNSGYPPSEYEIEQDVEAILATAGLIDNQVVWVVHSDTANTHAHIIVNAVNPENGVASQFDNKVARRFQEWARDKEQAIGVQCPGRENHVYKNRSRKFIPAAERRARARIAHMPGLHAMADELAEQTRREWRELRVREQQEISAIYERMRLIREEGQAQRKVIKSQSAAKIKNIYKKAKTPFFLTTAWLEKNEWRRLGRRTHAARRLFYAQEKTLSGRLINAIHLALSDMPHKKDFLHYLLSSDARRAGIEDWIGHEYSRLRTKHSMTKRARVNQIRTAERQCYISLSRHIQTQIAQENRSLEILKHKQGERRAALKKHCKSRWDGIGAYGVSVFNKNRQPTKRAPIRHPYKKI